MTAAAAPMIADPIAPDAPPTATTMIAISSPSSVPPLKDRTKPDQPNPPGHGARTTGGRGEDPDSSKLRGGPQRSLGGGHPRHRTRPVTDPDRRRHPWPRQAVGRPDEQPETDHGEARVDPEVPRAVPGG